METAKNILEAFRADLLALAFLGSLIAVSFWPPVGWKKTAATVAAGTVISGATAPGVYALVIWRWPEFPLEVSILGGLYFWIGLLGMKLVPVVAALLDKFRTAKLPGVDQ